MVFSAAALTLSWQVSWFPKAFSVIPTDAKNHAGVLTSFVLHFVAFTGHSLELYRVVTLSESLHTAKMILDRSSRYTRFNSQYY